MSPMPLYASIIAGDADVATFATITLRRRRFHCRRFDAVFRCH